MGFNEEIRLYADKLKYDKTSKTKYSPKAIDKAITEFKERNEDGDFEGWAWAEVIDDFIDAVKLASSRKSKPYRSGKRASK